MLARLIATTLCLALALGPIPPALALRPTAEGRARKELQTTLAPAAGLEERPMLAAEAVAWWQAQFGRSPQALRAPGPTVERLTQIAARAAAAGPTPPAALFILHTATPIPLLLGLMGWDVAVAGPHAAALDEWKALALPLIEQGIVEVIRRHRGSLNYGAGFVGMTQAARKTRGGVVWLEVNGLASMYEAAPKPVADSDEAAWRAMMAHVVYTVAPGGTIVLGLSDPGMSNAIKPLQDGLGRFAEYRVLEDAALPGEPEGLRWRFELAPLPDQLRAMVERAGGWTGTNAVVIHPNVIANPKCRGLGVLAELLPEMVMVDHGDEIVGRLKTRGVTHVDYYGERARAEALQQLTGITVEPQALWEAELTVVLTRILSHLTGQPESAVARRVDLRPIAAWLEWAA